MKIREARRQAGLTQAELAALIGTGQSQISIIERGRQDLSVGMLLRIARALAVPPAALLEEQTADTAA